MRPPGCRAPSVFIQGKVNHFAGRLRVNPGNVPKFDKIWSLKSFCRISLFPMEQQQGKGYFVVSLSSLQDLLRNYPYIKDFITVVEILEGQLTHCQLVIN